MKGKRGYIIGLSIIILIFGIWVIKTFKYRLEHHQLIDADKITGKKGADDNPKFSENSDLKKVGYVTLNGKKAKAPQFSFIDQNEDTITNKDYRGKVYVAEFFYTSCPTICPVMSKNLVSISNHFKGNKKFGIASFSIDPKYDTPEVLKKYAEKYDIKNPNWHFLTGKQKDIYKVAQNGFKINALEDPNEPGGIMHDGMFVLIDKEGYIRSRKDKYGNPILYYRGYIEQGQTDETGQEAQIDDIIQDIKNLLHE